jgi:hypothetical protein
VSACKAAHACSAVVTYCTAVLAVCLPCECITIVSIALCFCRTLISQDGSLLTALPKQPLPSSSFALGPLGNLLLRGEPVPAGAAFSATGQLVTADGQVLAVLPGSSDDDGAPCSGQETHE